MSPKPQLIEPLDARIALAFAAYVDLESLRGFDGFKFRGEQEEDRTGGAVAIAGDINGDGFADMIVGANDAGYLGEAYVIFGRSSDFQADFSPSMLDGQNGFKLAAEEGLDETGISVSGAGDINGDGFDDLIVGAFGGVANGAAYVVFGKASGFAAELSLATLNGTNGFKMVGNGRDGAGFSVSRAVDINGDGFDDAVIGAVDKIFVVFGKSEGFAAEIDLITLDGNNGFRMVGPAYGRVGAAVNTAGDVNGDGFDDLIIGAPGIITGFTQGGAAYVVFGHGGTFESTAQLSELDGSDGFRLEGTDLMMAGQSVATVGSINGDGFADIYVSTSYGSFLIFGRAEPFPAVMKLEEITGETGVKFNYGADCSTAGDINGDGIDDMIVGLAGASFGGTYSGAAFVIFGRTARSPEVVNIFALNGRDGFVLGGSRSFDYAGYSVSGGGDVNGDGFDDLIVGAPIGVPGDRPGIAYVVYGGDPGRLRVAEDGLSASYTDTDGDRITVRTDAGAFTEGMFDMRAEGVGFQLERLDLTDPGFSHATLEFLARRQDWNKDGTRDGNAKVDVGYLNASGVDLRSVIIPGDLGRIDCGDSDPLKPGLKSLTVQSLGARGTAAQDPGSSPSLHSEIVGDMKKLTVGSGITGGVTLAVEGRIGTVKIGGDLSDSTITALGALAPLTRAAAVAIQSITVGGSVNASQILAGYDLAGVAMNADVSIGKVLVHKKWIASDLVAGIADSTGDGFGQNDTLIPGGSDDIIARIATLRINGRATGTPAPGDSFGITAETITSATIHARTLPLTPKKNTLLLDKTNADFRLVEL
jgi:hypothetical protein